MRYILHRLCWSPWLDVLVWVPIRSPLDRLVWSPWTYPLSGSLIVLFEIASIGHRGWTPSLDPYEFLFESPLLDTVAEPLVVSLRVAIWIAAVCHLA